MKQFLYPLALAACVVSACSDDTASPSRPEAGGEERRVGVIAQQVVLEREAERIEALGTARAMASATIYPEAAGAVESVNFSAGDRVEEGEVLINEVAPRPHNSGHWTQNGCATSQFEQFVRAVAGLSVPYPGLGPKAPTEQMRAAFGERFFYQLYFQQPDVPEQELEADVRDFLRRMYHALSGPGMQEKFRAEKPVTGLLDILQPPTGGQPDWMRESDLDVYVERFEHSGLTGPINWYRAMDASWEESRDDDNWTITAPVLFLGGMQDPVLLFGQKALTRMPDYVPDLRTVVLDQCGHWIQMEQASEVNREILGFLEEISPRR